MKKVLQRILFVSMAMTLLASMTACAQPAPQASAGPSPSQAAQQLASQAPAEKESVEKIELRISWWGSESRHDATLAALDVYMQKNPHVTVIPEYQGWDGYHDKLAAQLASGTEPDVFKFDNYRYIADFASGGNLMDLAPYIGSIIDLSNFPEDALLWGRYKDVQYGIPSGMNGTVCMYNKAIFDAANLEYPKDDWTVEDFENAGKAIHAALPDTYALKEADWYLTAILIRQQGKVIADESGQIQDFRKELAVAYQKLNEWRENGIMPPLEESAAKNTQQDNLFLSGAAAINIKSVAQLPMDQGSMKDGNEIGVVMVPGSKQNFSVFMEGAMPWTIGNSSKHKEEAAKLINFLSNDVDAAAKLMTSRGVPCSSVARDAIAPAMSKVDLQVFEGVDRLIEFGQGKIDYFWTVKGNAQIGVILDEEKDNTGYGVKTPEQAADDAYDRILKVIEEASK